MNIFIYKNSGEIEKISFGFSGLFSYLYNCLLPFNNFENKEFLGSFISIFPLPMCLSLYYLYKNDKHIDFLLPITVVSVLGTVFCTSGFPNIVEKITLLEGVSNLRVMSAVNLANVFILFYFIANINEELFNIKNAIRITIVFIIVLAFIKYPTLFSNKKILYLFVCEFSLLLFTFLFHSDKRYKNTMLFLMVLLTMISGIPVNFFI